MTVLSFPVAPFLHEWSPSATIPRPTAKMDKLICLGWMFEKQKGGELGTGFLRRTSYEVLNKAHILEMRRLPRNTSKWNIKIHRETEGKMELLEEKRADWGKPQGRWQPWVPLKLPDSLLQQHGHAWWWQAQRESSRPGTDSQRVKDSPVFKPPEEHFKGWRAHSPFSNATLH